MKSFLISLFAIATFAMLIFLILGYVKYGDDARVNEWTVVR